jgi:hypothetical protein
VYTCGPLNGLVIAMGGRRHFFVSHDYAAGEMGKLIKYLLFFLY